MLNNWRPNNLILVGKNFLGVNFINFLGLEINFPFKSTNRHHKVFYQFENINIFG